MLPTLGGIKRSLRGPLYHRGPTIILRRTGDAMLARASLTLLAFAVLLSAYVAAFDITYDYTRCNRLALTLQASPQEANATAGMVLQFSQSANVSDPPLYNTTLLWTEFGKYVNYSSTFEPAIFSAPNRYYVNISLESTMNASWVKDGDARYSKYHTFFWLFQQPQNDSSPAARTPFGGPGGSTFVPNSESSPACYLYYFDNGTRTTYGTPAYRNPYLSDDDADHDRLVKLAAGLGVGLGVLALLLIVLLFCFVRKRLRHRDQTQGQNDAFMTENAGRLTMLAGNSVENRPGQGLLFGSQAGGSPDGKPEDKQTNDNGGSGSSSNNNNTLLDTWNRSDAGVSSSSSARPSDSIFAPIALPARVAADEGAPPPTYAEANSARRTG